jgi:flagellar motor protein MotB
VEGRGPDEPIADNKSGAGRAQNRRVDILLPRTD